MSKKNITVEQLIKQLTKMIEQNPKMAKSELKIIKGSIESSIPCKPVYYSSSDNKTILIRVED